MDQLINSLHRGEGDTTTFTGLEVDPGESLADTAAQSGIIDLRPFREAEEALFYKFGLKPRVINGNNQAVGIGGKAKVLGKVEMPSGMGGVNGILKYTVVESSGVPPLTPVSLLKQVGAVIDLNNNTMELKKIGATTALRILPTGHVAHKLTEFASGGWKAPTPEQTKLFQARSDVFRPVTLPGESKQRRQYQTVDFSSGLAYTVSNHSHVFLRSNICACDRSGDDQLTSDRSSGAVLTQKPSTSERSFAFGFDVDANSEMGKSHIDRRVSVATTYPAMPRSCHSGSLASRHRRILPNRANRVYTSTGTSCLSSQSMGINGRMRQKTLRIWRAKIKEKAKKKDSVNIIQKAALIASGALDEKERDSVCPMCNRELYAFRTAAGPIMRCQGWDLTGMPHQRSPVHLKSTRAARAPLCRQMAGCGFTSARTRIRWPFTCLVCVSVTTTRPCPPRTRHHCDRRRRRGAYLRVTTRTDSRNKCVTCFKVNIRAHVRVNVHASLYCLVGFRIMFASTPWQIQAGWKMLQTQRHPSSNRLRRDVGKTGSNIHVAITWMSVRFKGQLW